MKQETKEVIKKFEEQTDRDVIEYIKDNWEDSNKVLKILKDQDYNNDRPINDFMEDTIRQWLIEEMVKLTDGEVEF